MGATFEIIDYMNERGGLLVGLVMAGLILSVGITVVLFAVPRFSTTQTDLDDTTGMQNDGTVTSSLTQAQKLKTQADLRAISTQLTVYYVEQSSYPTSLVELTSSMGTDIDTANIIYEKCSSSSVAFYHNSPGFPGYIHESTQVRSVSGSSPPSCY